MKAIFKLLNPDNTMSINRQLAHAIGLAEAVVYGALLSKYAYYDQHGLLTDGDWFYSTVEDLEESTALTARQQRRCIDTHQIRTYSVQGTGYACKALLLYQ
ncbi:putative uncharacterized protein [Eubacterium sp. CAG:786]|nr:putative uncharacterized protein [Eubacterium sp. CAG:786]